MKTNFLTGTDNATYHNNRSHVSSSGLKTVLKDPAAFYREYVLNERLQSEADFFLEGTLAHSLVLEPHLVASEYAVFTGLRKAGKLWEDFKVDPANEGRKLVSAVQMLRCQKLAEAHNRSKLASALVNKNGLSEHSMLGEIGGVGVKARADYINVAGGYILDVKTTSAATGLEFFQETINQYSYQLSAALYTQIAEQTYGRPFEFYFEVLSKQDQGCAIYRTSEATMSKGKQMVRDAIEQLKRCRATGVWESTRPASVSEQFEVEEV